ncbi:MAG: hypothetical protein A2W03_08005 [Candidatus Aminicenantes bacterium RBG_16_63_16]|nr:MAG: hypothetical protein A2W03_08005 [Candidatus Aminicenantes bacterium RBG_16_63_16]
MDKQVAYYVQGKDKTLYFTPGGMTLVLKRAQDSVGARGGTGDPGGPSSSSARGQAGDKHEAIPGLEKGEFEKMPSNRYVVKLDFSGANSGVRPEGRDKTAAVISYFRGGRENWHTAIPTYSEILYRDLWPGIDLVYSGTVDRLKYEFIVHPGADPSQIRLAYRGIEGMDLERNGRLRVATPLSDFYDDAPVAWQQKDGERKNIPIAYEVDHSEAAESHSYGFSIGEYDHAQTLVLDPAVFVFCGFIGGSAADDGYGIAVDMTGNVYVTGSTASDESTFPVTVGPDLTHNSPGLSGYPDAFVAKINPQGTALIYCGYIGGSKWDIGKSIAVDSGGNAFICGYTESTESTFPFVVGPDLTFNGITDAFVAKLSPTGTNLVYCGYIGGNTNDDAEGIAVDGTGNAYIAGLTYSSPPYFPVMVGPDLTPNGGMDGYVAKVNASGSGLVYCGFIGGSGSDAVRRIAVDSSGYAYISGETRSTEASFPVAGGPDLTFNGGVVDAFIAKVDVSGASLIYCGYLGGTDWDEGKGIAVDQAGNAYVTGFTSSSPAEGFPVIGGPDLTHNGLADAFVAKVNASGTGIGFCGYIGGASDDKGYGIALDPAGNVNVQGWTKSSQATFPVKLGPDLTHNGDADLFAARVDPSGSRLDYCSYIGGSLGEYGYALAVDQSGNAFVTGYIYDSGGTLSVVTGPDLSWNGDFDALVARIQYFDERVSRHAVGDFDGDGRDEAAVDFGTGGVWIYDGGAWTQLTPANPESLLAADVDGDTLDEILADQGANGLWLWNAGEWSQLSAVNGDGMAAGDVDADGAAEVVGDFAAVGLWLYNAGSWTQLSGVNADWALVRDLDGSGGAEIVGDFGVTGLWLWNADVWTQLSGVNADYAAFGDTNGTGGHELVGDFGATGLWLWGNGSWTQLSGLNADYLISADVDNSGDDEVIGDFGATGLWLWDSGVWTILSGLNADFIISANVDNDGDDEMVADFGPLGLWLWARTRS